MKIYEIISESAKTAWKKTGQNKVSRRYRCQSGPRKGRVMASPASCNAPLNHKKRANLVKNKAKSGKQRNFKRQKTMRQQPGSKRARNYNRSKK